jgi:uncharacterized protein YjbI with pentapeptide repeats
MKIEIKHRFSYKVVFSHKQENNSIKATAESAVRLGVSLSNADLSGADLSSAYLSRAYLYGAYLSGADLSGADLFGANLYGANLSGADLYGANLYGANLYGADLSGADLYGANLYGANLYGADLSGASYGPATLKKGFLQLSGKYWPVFIFDAHIKIGCKLHSTEEWKIFTDEEISRMDRNALSFWKNNKNIILALADNHQEEPK